MSHLRSPESTQDADLRDLMTTLRRMVARQEITKHSEFVLVVVQHGYDVTDPIVRQAIERAGLAEWLDDSI